MKVMDFLYWIGLGLVIGGIALIIFTNPVKAYSTSDQIGGRTMDEQIAIVNGQNPSHANDHGVGITNGQTGRRRSTSAFETTTRDLCAAAYPGDALGQTLCRDNERRVRSDQIDRYFGIGDYGHRGPLGRSIRDRIQLDRE